MLRARLCFIKGICVGMFSERPDLPMQVGSYALQVIPFGPNNNHPCLVMADRYGLDHDNELPSTPRVPPHVWLMMSFPHVFPYTLLMQPCFGALILLYTGNYPLSPFVFIYLLIPCLVWPIVLLPCDE